MEPEKCKKLCFPPYISCRWNGHPGITAGDGNCILITGLMVSVLHQMEGPFQREAHSLPWSIFPLKLVNKTRQETKVMRLLSDPRDFIPSSVALLGVQSESRKEMLLHTGYQTKGKGRDWRKDSSSSSVFSDPCGFFSG